MRARSRLSFPSLLARLLTISPDPGDLGGAGGHGEKQQQRRQGQEGLGQDDRVTSPHGTDPALASPGALGGLCACPSALVPRGNYPLPGTPFSALRPLSLPEKPDSPSLRVSTGSRDSPVPSEPPSLVRVLFPEWARAPDARSRPGPGPVPSCCLWSSERLRVCCPRLRPRLRPPRVICWALASRPGPAPCGCRAPLSPPPHRTASASTVRGARGGGARARGPPASH